MFKRLSAARALSSGKKRNRTTRLSLSEVMTILALYHASGYKSLKAFYLEEVIPHHKREFPALCSYRRLCNCNRDV